uniref:Uncharacterized protein n=1 Tax=Rhizophora mucronata TaxID=61149 RepID=A0A2P2NAS0_RHIMU
MIQIIFNPIVYYKHIK